MSFVRQSDFFDLLETPPAKPAVRPQTLVGQRAYLAGVAAENSVELSYCRRGMSVAARRWRNRGGEIDLIFRDGNTVVFVEVKQARTFAYAAERVTPRQKKRLLAGASAFLATEPAGELTPCRFDVALVDASGRIEVLENALAA
ncbi:YraN family protein [Shimia biformata]|uniref:YraN family protein n=1 Tax=Shimia biformata TaxID=1294299 RepID=UPI001951999D|nr:YraN family protein [Shimia biformata]